MKSTALLTLTAALLAIGCGKGGDAAVKPEAGPEKTPEAAPSAEAAINSPADLVDFKIGDQWVYTMDQALQTAEGNQEFKLEMTMKVLNVEEKEGSTVATLETTSTDSVSGQVLGRDILSWELSDKGLYQTAVANGDETYSPPLPLVPLPLVDGQGVEHTGTGPREGTDKPGPFQAELRHVGWQEVDTDMGRMRAYAIDGIRKFTVNQIPVTSVITLWVAPGHGIVRALSETSTQESRVTVLRRLKSHTEAKEGS